MLQRDVLQSKTNHVLLLDFYGRLLTDKSVEIADLHFNEDMTLTEIAESLHISKQAVYDAVRRIKTSLETYEAKLNLVARFQEQKDLAAGALEALEKEEKKEAVVLLNRLLENF